jgi:hypothetical protein
MDQVDIPVSDQRSQPAHPSHPSPAEAVDRDPQPLQVGGQGVLLGQQVRHLVLEPVGVPIGGGADQELLGPAAAEALDEDKDPLHRPITSGGTESASRACARR